MSISALLKRYPLFSDLKSTQIKALEKKLSVKHFKMGKVLYMEDSPTDQLYLLEAGTVKLTKFLSDGREQILRIVKPISLLGFEGLFLERYTATAEALTETAALMIEKNEFKSILREDISIAFKMMEMLNDELEKAKRMLCDLGLKTARERMASFLLSQVHVQAHPDPKKPIPMQLDLSRKEIASMLGLTQETVIRILSDFNATRLITLDGKSISILNITRLLALAESE